MDTNAPVISIIVRIHIIIITIMVLRIASILLWLAMDILIVVLVHQMKKDVVCFLQILTIVLHTCIHNIQCVLLTNVYVDIFNARILKITQNISCLPEMV